MSFKTRFDISGISAFLRQTVRNCIKDGYVQTLMGRRRYLPGITSDNAHIKAHVSTFACQDLYVKHVIQTSRSASHTPCPPPFFFSFFFRQSGRRWTRPYRARQLISLNLPLWTSRDGCGKCILQLHCLISTHIQVTRAWLIYQFLHERHK